MRKVFWLTSKDLLLLWRDRFALFWVFGFPLMFSLFFGAVTSGWGGGRGRISLAIIDQDRSESSKALLEKLANHGSLRVEAAHEGSDELNLAEAKNRVRRGDLTACLVVQEGFADSLRSFAGQTKKIEVGIDPSRQAEAGFLQGILMEATFTVLFRQFTNPADMTNWVREGRLEVERADDLSADQKRTLGELFALVDDMIPKLDQVQMPGDAAPFAAARVEMVPVTFDQARPRSSWEVMFPSSILWAILSCMTTFAISIVVERKQGTLLRLRTAPITQAQILASKGLACFLSCAGSALVLLGLGMAIFGVRVADWTYLLVGIGSAAFSFAGLMMLLSVLGKTEQAVGGSASAIMVVMAMLGGGMIPLIAMPDWMLTVSHISPVKWGILALEGAIWRGFTLSEMLLPCGILVAVGLVSFALGVRVLATRSFT